MYVVIVIATGKLMKEEGRKEKCIFHVTSGLTHQHEKESCFEDWVSK